MHVASASASIVLSVVQVPRVGRVFRVPLRCFRPCFWRYVCCVRRVLFVFPVAPEALFSQNDHPAVPQQLLAVAQGRWSVGEVEAEGGGPDELRCFPAESTNMYVPATCNLRCPPSFCPSHAYSTLPLDLVPHASALLIAFFSAQRGTGAGGSSRGPRSRRSCRMVGKTARPST